MKTLFFLASLMSVQAFGGDPTCRLSISGMDRVLGTDSVLIAQVTAKLDKKNIVLIENDEMIEGDFSISSLIAFDDKTDSPYRPLNSYKFTTKPHIVFVPCVAFPLCSPVMLDNEVTGIVGKKYKDDYAIEVLRDSKLQEIQDIQFKHNYSGITKNSYEAFDGTPEQVDLAMAIASKLPKCSTLRKWLDK